MPSKKIKIVTDSVADIPEDLLEKWNIDVIPCYVNFEGESYADDGVELDRDEYYRKLPDMTDHPSTAAPPPGLTEEMLHTAIEGHDHLVCIHVPEKLSATINNVRIGAQSLPDDKVTIIDSQKLSMAIGYQAIIAAEVAAETGDVHAVVDAVHRVRENVKLYAVFNTLEYLKRSGRVSAVVAGVGSLLRIKPIVDVVDGEVELAHRVRTFSRAVDKLEELLREQMPLDRMTLLEIRNREDAQKFGERVKDIMPEGTGLVRVGPTLGTHIGPGAIGFASLRKNWKK
jgi:DegV family protein with EDD domain